MDMDMNMNMSHESSMQIHGQWTHMTFFWGARSEILFSGWPGDRTGMYVLALVVVFLLSVIYEWLSHSRLLLLSKSSSSSSSHEQYKQSPGAVAGLVRAVAHASRSGLMYVIMLAVMSFNVGVLVVVVVGHVVGFWLFG